MLRFVGDGDQKKLTKNPRHFSMQNSRASSKKKSTKVFWRAGRVTFSDISSTFDHGFSFSGLSHALAFTRQAGFPRVDPRRPKYMKIEMCNNMLIGELPAFSGLTSGVLRSFRQPSLALEELDLSENKLTGSISEKLGDFEIIRQLSFWSNELTKA